MGEVEITRATGSQSVDGVTSTSADGAATKSLTLEQSNYISTIMGQLLVSGYDEDFVQEIGSAMEKMYTESFTFKEETFESFNDFLDVKLPETIKSSGGVSYANIEKRKDNDGTFSKNLKHLMKETGWPAYPSPDAQAVHQMVTDKDSIELRRILTEARRDYFKNHGVNFEIIRNWLDYQQTNSWSAIPKEVKILLMQMKKCRSGNRDCVYLGPPEEEADIRFLMQLQPSDEFKESLVLQKAFTAIALSKIKAPGVVDTGNATIKLRRGLILSDNFRRRVGLQGAEAGDMVGKEFTEEKNGIADSTAFGTPSPTFCFAANERRPMVVVEYEMPICDVHAAFMYEEELVKMGGWSGYDEFFKWQHEFVCDLVDKKAKIIYVDIMKNIDARGL
ncbi:MAG: hypothetical protein LBF49_02520 [Puniceicoccales bacterium]|nr:hypothetical protein [Puniceicoccales bacterium]